jgi:type II secretory pathway component PulC
LVLKGIAKDTDGQMLAVVVSNNRRAYFLRENDQVFNGNVQKITTDSVIFRELGTDHLGRETAHEVVKKIPKS